MVYSPTRLFPTGTDYNVTTCGTKTYYWNATHLYGLGANFGGTLGANNFSYTDTRCSGAIEITTISDEGEDIVGMACNSATMMAWTLQGHVFGWGVNSYRQISGEAADVFSAPTRIDLPISNVIKVSIGQEHVLALSDSGEVACWGRNRRQQCNSDLAIVTPPAIAFATVNASDIAAGSQHTLVLSTSGEVFSAGYNHYGQCCQPSIAYRAETPNVVANPPSAIVGDAFYGRPISKIAATRDGSFFVTDEGRLFGCGINTAIGFGNIAAPLVDRPREIFVLPSDTLGSNSKIESIFASSTAYHTLFSTSDLRLVGVGSNTGGELGLNSSLVMATKSVISLNVSADITNVPILNAQVSGYQSVVETDSSLIRPTPTNLRPQCEVQGCTCPAPLEDAICVDGEWTGPNLVLWENTTLSVGIELTGNLTLAPGGSLTLPFGSILRVKGCAQFYGGFINYTISPAQLLQIYRTPLLFINTTCGAGSPSIHLAVNGTQDPCNNVTVSQVRQGTDGLYMIFQHNNACGKKIAPWIIGVIVAAVAVVVIAVLLVVFLVKPVRLAVFPFYKRQLNENSETQALRSTAAQSSQVELAESQN